MPLARPPSRPEPEFQKRKELLIIGLEIDFYWTRISHDDLLTLYFREMESFQIRSELCAFLYDTRGYAGSSFMDARNLSSIPFSSKKGFMMRWDIGMEEKDRYPLEIDLMRFRLNPICILHDVLFPSIKMVQASSGPGSGDFLFIPPASQWEGTREEGIYIYS